MRTFVHRARAGARRLTPRLRSHLRRTRETVRNLRANLRPLVPQRRRGVSEAHRIHSDDVRAPVQQDAGAEGLPTETGPVEWGVPNLGEGVTPKEDESGVSGEKRRQTQRRR